MKDWITTISLDLFRSDSLEPNKKLCSAMTILCCLHILQNQPYFQDIKDEVLLSLLRMAALPSRGDKDFQYLFGMMPEEESRSVDFNRLETGLSFA